VKIQTEVVPDLALPVVLAVIEEDGQPPAAATARVLVPTGLDPRTVESIEWMADQIINGGG
jgi:hypothetical protein